MPESRETLTSTHSAGPTVKSDHIEVCCSKAGPCDSCALLADEQANFTEVPEKDLTAVKMP